MAIEALLAINPTFVHKPQHDLESILHIILYICTFIHGPGLPLSQHKLDVTHRTPPPIRTWFSNNDIREIGYQKLAHLECCDVAILPYFTPYWHDFSPFVRDLIVACFPGKACLSNNFHYDRVLQILTTAYDSVREPQIGHVPKAFGAQSFTRIPKRASDSLHRDSKKGRLF